MLYRDILSVSMLALSQHVNGRPLSSFHVLGLESCLQVCQNNIWFDRPSKFIGRSQEPVWQVVYHPESTQVVYDNTEAVLMPDLVKFTSNGVEVVGETMYFHMWKQDVLDGQSPTHMGMLVSKMWVTLVAKVGNEVIAYNQYHEGGVVTALYDPEPDDIKDTDAW
jgi:hypothetical protein